MDRREFIAAAAAALVPAPLLAVASPASRRPGVAFEITRSADELLMGADGEIIRTRRVVAVLHSGVATPRDQEEMLDRMETSPCPGYYVGRSDWDARYVADDMLVSMTWTEWPNGTGPGAR